MIKENKIEYPNTKQEKPTYNFNVMGFFSTTSTVPTGVPATWVDQVKIYVNGATYRLYWYDNTNHSWHYVTATA